MAYQNTVNYYRLNFAMIQIHKYSLTEIDNMIPFERDLYVELLMQHLEQQNENNQ